MYYKYQIAYDSIYIYKYENIGAMFYGVRVRVLV